MAKDSHQQRKQQLVEALSAKRSAVEVNANSLKASISGIPKTPQAIASSALKPNVRNITKSAFLKSNPLAVNTKKGFNSKVANLPWKKISFGVGTLIVTKKILSKGKRKKSVKQSDGVGSSLFKWTLAASLPIVKHLVSQKMKKSF